MVHKHENLRQRTSFLIVETVGQIFTICFPQEDLKLLARPASLRISHVSSPPEAHKNRRASRRDVDIQIRELGKLASSSIPSCSSCFCLYHIDWIKLESFFDSLDTLLTIVYLAYDSTVPKVILHTVWINRLQGS